MVKNFGGNKSKKMGRKFLGPATQKDVRLANPKEPCEIYGVVEKLFGHGRFQIRDPDGKLRLVIIPNKFRGRGKRDNTVTQGAWVLVGIREYESSEDPKCDLLEVYSDTEKKKLKKLGDPLLTKLKSDHDKEPVDDDMDFTFSNDDDSSRLQDMISKAENVATEDTVQFEGEAFDLDDI